MTVLTPDELCRCYELGKQRNSNHRNAGNYQHTSDKVHVMGVKGELAFAKRYGLEVDTEDRPQGDDHDFQAEWGNQNVSIDVKATKYFDDPWLKVKAGKVNNDIYILTAIDGPEIELVGWASKDMIKQKDPSFETGHEENHVLRGEELNPLPTKQMVNPQ